MDQPSQDHASQDFLALMVALAVLLAGFIWVKVFTSSTAATGAGKEMRAAILITETVQKRVDAVIGTPSGAIVAAGDRPLTLLDASKPSAPGVPLLENPGRITALLLSDFALWVATDSKDHTGGLLQVHDLAQSTTRTVHVALPGAPTRRVTALASGLGRLWVGTTDGLLSYDWSGWKQHALPTRFHIPSFSRDVTALYLDNRGILWIGTSSGLFAYNGSEVFPHTTHHGLPSNAITVITGDASGTLYCGTERGLASLHGDVWVRQSSIDEKVTALLIGDDGLWVGTTSDLHHHLDGKWVELSKFQQLPAGGITALAYGPDSLFLGTEQGLYRLPLARLEEPQPVPVPPSPSPSPVPSPKH